MDDLCRRIQSETLVRKTHLLCEGGVGRPRGGMAGVGLLHHLVDLLEGKTFGFGLKVDVSACAVCSEGGDDLQLGSRQKP